MTKADLIKVLNRYDDNVEINFFLIPKDGSEEDSDEYDVQLKFVDELYTGGLEDNDPPYVDLGFQTYGG